MLLGWFSLAGKKRLPRRDAGFGTRVAREIVILSNQRTEVTAVPLARPERMSGEEKEIARCHYFKYS